MSAINVTVDRPLRYFDSTCLSLHKLITGESTAR